MVNGHADRHREAADIELLLVFYILMFLERIESLHLFFSMKDLLFFCGNQHLNSLTKNWFIIVT